ncbi:SRPBCC family protein [bacterium]|nr:SRPBCC family protein [Verrucomicrobiota bacterium]MDA7559525.1 SRPBCC family protein [bacterium]MDA7620954.1 SRPBCC family protein [Verrucomicrobiota bacterium]
MLRFEKRTTLACSASTLYNWHMLPDAFQTLTPPWEKVSIVSRPESLQNGAKIKLQLCVGPLRIFWVALHENFVEGRRFDDVQLSGPFRKWHHSHLFEPVAEDSSIMHDSITFEIPGGRLLNRLASPIVNRRLKKMFHYRHQQLVSIFGQIS